MRSGGSTLRPGGWLLQQEPDGRCRLRPGGLPVPVLDTLHATRVG